MATYNGGKFLKQQLDSILCQLGFRDELIVSDDGSSDTTLEILSEYQKEDVRVQVFVNPRKGFVSNFENALRQCKNDIIFLSDQDDIWLPNKVQVVTDFMSHSGKFLVLHNGLNFHENSNSTNDMLIKKMRHGVFLNIMMSCYWGCCMAFKRELIDMILPFPARVPTHDQWIGLVAEQTHQSVFLNQPLLMHRKHADNVSRSLPFFQKINFRVYFLLAYFMSLNRFDC